MKKYYMVLIIALLISSMPAFSAQKMRIAIMDFEAKDIPKKDAEKVTELIRNEMVNTGKFTVIERAQVGSILKEQGLQQTGCTDVTCAVEVGKILSARKILVGTIMSLKGKVVITGRIVDVESSVVEFSEKGVAKSDEEVYDAVISFTRNLTKRITSTVEAEPAEKEKGPAAGESLSSVSNPYLWPSIGLAGLSALSFGGGIYYNIQVDNTQADYDDVATKYNAANNTNDAKRLGNKMTSLEKDADKYTLYRNISYGVGSAFLVTAGYFIYRYFIFSYRW